MIKIIKAEGIRTTYVGGDKEVTFVEGRAKVDEKVAKELLSRPGGIYTDITVKRGGVVDDGEPSMERLNIEYDRMFRAKRLPELRGWLKARAGELEPALLTMQQSGELPLVGQQEQVKSPIVDGKEELSKKEIKSNKCGVDGGEDDEEVDIDADEVISIEGNTIKTKDGIFTVDDPVQLKIFKKAFKKSKKNKK